MLVNTSHFSRGCLRFDKDLISELLKIESFIDIIFGMIFEERVLIQFKTLLHFTLILISTLPTTKPFTALCFRRTGTAGGSWIQRNINPLICLQIRTTLGTGSET